MTVTDEALNNTCGQIGGRPSFIFYSEDISGGASRANNTSYSLTIIAGSSSAGDPLLLHFQIKTHAQSKTVQKLSIDLFSHAKYVVGQFSWTDRRQFPCTWGMNEKAGMDAVELDKYFVNSILPLFPDVEDVPKKKVRFFFVFLFVFRIKYSHSLVSAFIMKGNHKGRQWSWAYKFGYTGIHPSTWSVLLSRCTKYNTSNSRDLP